MKREKNEVENLLHRYIFIVGYNGAIAPVHCFNIASKFRMPFELCMDCMALWHVSAFANYYSFCEAHALYFLNDIHILFMNIVRRKKSNRPKY